MKKMMLVCCVAALCFTSCLNDSVDSNRGLTPEEISKCEKEVKGAYQGHLIFEAKNEKDVKDVTDTLNIHWAIENDSTMAIYQFPTKLLAANVSNEELKAAIEAQPDQDIKCRIGFVNTSPIQFLINPNSPAYTVDFEGKEHKIQVAFYVNSTNSFGTHTYEDAVKKNTKILYMQIIEGAIFMDGKETSYLKQPKPFAFESKLTY